LSTLLLADNFTLLFIARICVGLGQGLTFPSAHQIAGTWYPMQERSRLVNFVASGMDIGVVVALLFSPLILHALKWQWVPIVFSMFAIVWVTCFSIFAASSPEQDKRITDEEREFILANRAGGTTNVTRAIDHIRSSKTQQHGVISNGSIPWKELFLSRAAWACYLSHFCKNFTWHVLLNWIPQYFRDVLKLNLAKNGVLAALPYLFGFLTTVVCGRISDYLVVTKKIRTLRVRRLMNSISYFGAAFFIFLLRYTTDPKLAVLLLTACLMFIRISVSGLTVNIVDIGGVRSGLVMGVSNTFGIMPGIIGNVITGQILEASNDWGLVFLIASLTLICGGLIFQFFSSDQCIFKDSIGEEQEQGQDQWEHREQSLHQRTIKTP
jgi:ACS family sodium-dependent inorganic phosphate cotransporter